MIKGKDLHCPSCGQHWTQCAEGQSSYPETWAWSSNSTQRSNSASRQRTRSQSQSKHAQRKASGKKGKGSSKQDMKGGGKGKDNAKHGGKPADGSGGFSQPSPFAIYQTSPSLTPWIQDTAAAPPGDSQPSVLGSGSTHSNVANSELVAALAKAYPDREQMPADVRELLDKANQHTSRSITKDLHTETSNLGKAKKLLQEVSEAKRAHKQAWTRHLADSIELWQKQLAEYNQQQSLLAERESKAARDIQAANMAIQSLNQQAAGSGTILQAVPEPLPPANPELTPTKDKEIIELQKRLQQCLGECAVATGVKPLREKIVEEVMASDDEENAKKRQRSQEPTS